MESQDTAEIYQYLEINHAPRQYKLILAAATPTVLYSEDETRETIFSNTANDTLSWFQRKKTARTTRESPDFNPIENKTKEQSS